MTKIWRHVSICSSFKTLSQLSILQVNELRSEQIAAVSHDKVLEQFMRTNCRTLVDNHSADLKIYAIIVTILNDTGIRPDLFNVRIVVVHN